MAEESLAARLELVQEKIRSAAGNSGRNVEDIELIVVSKNHDYQLVIDLLDLGVTNFGENKDQEASAKATQVALARPDLKPVWHFVGQLQSNKVKSMLNYSTFLHSLDRDSLLKELNKQLERTPERQIQVFIELNLTDDPGRGGVLPQNMLEFAEKVLVSKQLVLLGVMGVAGLDVPCERDFERIARYSEQLRQLAPNAKYISAGMSADFEQAIAFGATHIRVGTAITGKR